MPEAAKQPSDTSALPSDEEFNDSIGDGLDEEFDLSDLEDDAEETDTEAPKDEEGAPPADKQAPAKPASDAQPGDAKKQDDVPSGDPAAGDQPAADGVTDTAPKPPEGFRAEPLTFRAERQTFELPGSGRIDGFMLIPEASWPEVAALLSEGTHHRSTWRQERTQLHTQLRELRESRTLAERQAEATVKFFGDLARKGPEAVADFLDEYRENLPKLELQFEKQALEAERKARAAGAAGPTLRPGEATADGTPIVESPLEPEQLQGEMREQLLDLRATVPGLALLSDDDVTALVQDFGDEAGLNAVFRVALEDIPELGVAKGEVVVHRDFLVKQAQRLLSLRTKAGEQVKAATQAVATNAAKQQPKRTPPPTLSATTQQSGGEGKGGKKTFKSKEEFDAYFNETPIEELLKD